MRAFLLFLLLMTAAWANPTFEGGTDRKTTEKFKVEGPWTLRWNFEGVALKVFIYTDKAGAAAKPISQAGSGSGSLDVEHGGTFWLEIESVGTYKLSVEPRAAGALPVFEGNLERKGTSVFSAPQGWGFRYSGQGVLKLTLFDANRNQVGAPAVLLGGGSAEQMVNKPGQYFFMIQSTGPYRIEIFKR